MTIKSEVLRLLENNRGQYYSGSRIAGELYVSRNSVWKAVRSLQKDGHQIRAVTNKGYCLLEEDGMLTKESIEKYLTGEAKNLTVQVFPEVTSTNTLLKQMAEKGAPEGLVIAANRQTAGKGRSGRAFQSPPDTGIYFSLLLRPDCSQKDALMITVCAAAAVSEGISRAAGLETEIKWVNDVLLDGKKICGILTEASVDFESGGLAYAVLGIGVNVKEPEEGFSKELQGIVGSLFGRKPCSGDMRNRLIGEILSIFMGYYGRLSEKAYLKTYRERSAVIGREVEAWSGKEKELVRVLDIEEDGGLLVESADGEKKTLHSGEIRIRAKEGESW